MTTLEIYVRANIDTMQENIELLKELGNDVDRLVIQGYVLKKHLDSFIGYLEQRRKFDEKEPKDKK